ncbi:MAG: LysM peptidoglycan-binding domain-containing protein [Bacillota bacterium]|jgi:LysM repeat protein|nr:MAG: LysM peptidoglycan-binding domain-containing protein [Bacillota bacterium]
MTHDHRRRLAIILACILAFLALVLSGQGAVHAADFVDKSRLVEAAEILLPEGPPLPVVSYPVQRGDTLWALACQFRVDEETIRSANPGLRMWPGDEILIPLWPSRLWVDAGGGTLRELAEYTGLPLADIMQANGLASDAVFAAGQRVWLPLAIPENGIALSEVCVETGEGPIHLAQPLWPVVGRLSRLYGGPRVHKGLDIVAPIGTQIVAPRWGTVSAVRYDDILGLHLVLESTNGVEMLFAHLSEVLVGPGHEVSLGQVIGKVGDNGNSTGAHLHWEIRVYGELYDPAIFLGVGG